MGRDGSHGDIQYCHRVHEQGESSLAEINHNQNLSQVSEKLANFGISCREVQAIGIANQRG